MTRYHFKKYEHNKAPHTFLKQADEILAKRGQEYGHFLDLFRNTSKRMSLALGKSVNPCDVARLMIELKLSRLDEGDYKEDTIIDIINYAALLGSIKYHMEVVDEGQSNSGKTMADINFADILNGRPSDTWKNL